ncbi:MAG: hypothetical protein ABFD75_12100 [Smithella sp.]
MKKLFIYLALLITSVNIMPPNGFSCEHIEYAEIKDMSKEGLQEQICKVNREWQVEQKSINEGLKIGRWPKEHIKEDECQKEFFRLIRIYKNTYGVIYKCQ